MNLRTTLSSSRRALRRGSTNPSGAHRRVPTAYRRPALFVAIAGAGALVANVVTTGDPAAHAAAQQRPVSVSQQLGQTARTNGLGLADLEPQQEQTGQTASRSDREVLQSAAAQAQAAAEEAERQRQAAEAAAKAEAERQAAAQAAQQQAQAQQAQAAAVSADPGSIQGWTASFMSATYGWGGDQMSCLVSLWNRESGWRVSAANPSGAYGIPQALPGSKMASAGGDWQTNPQTQVKWGLGYIQATYGTPCGAWGHSQSTGWY